MLDILYPAPSLPGFELRALAAVLLTSLAAYYDYFNKKWVPDWVAHASVALALAANLLLFDAEVFFQASSYFIAVFAIGYLLYRLGQLGGADIYILASVAAILPHLPNPLLSNSPSPPYPFVLSILIPTGLIFMLHMLWRFIPFISRRLSQGKVSLTPMKIAEAAFLLFALGLFLSIATALPFSLPPAYMALFSFLFASLLFFSLFKAEIKESMMEWLPPSRLCEEDVLALEKLDSRTIRSLRLSPVMDRAMIGRIRKSKKRMPVYTGMPFFLPYLLFGLVVSLLFGDLFFYLL